MKAFAMRAFLAAVVLVLLGIGYAGRASPDGPAPAPGKRTVVLIALGDSITTAAMTCGVAFNCPDYSWVTGTRVDSLYQQLRARKKVNVRPVNLAEPGDGVAHLAGQASTAVARKADYITILIGANDACQWPMMGRELFQAYVNDALEVIRRGRPKAHVAIVSIPDVVQVWKIAHGNLLAVLIWQLKECPSVMTRATSTAPADVNRRRTVARRVNAYNSELERACQNYGPRCHWDGGRAHRVKFTPKMVAIDYFHPSRRGQQELARISLPPSWIGS
jgi:lysophospholipase L1-like esterase